MVQAVLIGFWPFLAVLGWAYWNAPTRLPRDDRRRRFDGIVLLLAVVTGAVALRWSYQAHYLGEGTTLTQVLWVLAAYGWCLLFLGAAYVLRPLLLRRSKSGSSSRFQ